MRLSFPEATWNALDRCTADKSVRHKRGPKSQGDLQHAFTFHHDLLLRKLLPATPRARADEPDVGIPHILKRILRISLLARTVNREPALFWANHGPCGSDPRGPITPADMCTQLAFDSHIRIPSQLTTDECQKARLPRRRDCVGNCYR